MAYTIKKPKAIERRNRRGGIRSGLARSTKSRDEKIISAFAFLTFSKLTTQAIKKEAQKGAQAFYNLKSRHAPNLGMKNGYTPPQAVRILAEAARLSVSQINKITKIARVNQKKDNDYFSFVYREMKARCNRAESIPP